DFVHTTGGFRILLTFSLLFSAYTIARYYRSPWRKVPHGPRGYPLIGNALELGGSKLWLKLTKWRDVYGDLVYLNAAGKPVIIINSVKAAVDLLDRRAANTSNRPKNIVASELLTGGMFMTLQNLTDEWRRMRKASHEHLSKSNATAYHASQVTESVLLALG
ncbi:cytochrome P450, partial [Stereum hirsutum FP-91666 SS1]|uniref:cytochrome P450 n=1 Tax=Stereum hirsutum (strain FP-91666) TaxID=721885 RepID=UPI000444A765